MSDSDQPGAAASAAKPGDLTGSVLGGRYQILGELSRGGMGVVYKARHNVLKHLVAIKVLRKLGTEAEQQRFLLEARLVTKLKHPNIVYNSDFGLLDDGRYYLAMEFLQGPTLAEALAASQGRFDPLRALRIAYQIARGMRAVHAQGIVHRDLKPDPVICARPAAGARSRRNGTGQARGCF